MEEGAAACKLRPNSALGQQRGESVGGPHVCGAAAAAPSAGMSPGPGGTASGNAVRLVPMASADICAVR